MVIFPHFQQQSVNTQNDERSITSDYASGRAMVRRKIIKFQPYTKKIAKNIQRISVYTRSVLINTERIYDPIAVSFWHWHTLKSLNED